MNKYALICGYNLNKNDEPKFAIATRQKVQGALFTDSHAYLSISYGRKNDSYVVCYTNPLTSANGSGDYTLPATSDSITLSDGTKVPLYFLDKKNHVKTIKLPPMLEGITRVGSRLVAVSESGAEEYRPGGKSPLDTLISLPLNLLQK